MMKQRKEVEAAEARTRSAGEATRRRISSRRSSTRVAGRLGDADAGASRWRITDTIDRIYRRGHLGRLRRREERERVIGALPGPAERGKSNP